MTTVNSRTFSENPIHYLNLAKNDHVVVERGDCKFHITLEMPKPQEILEPDEDLRRAITMDELRDSTLAFIDKLFASK